MKKLIKMSINERIAFIIDFYDLNKNSFSKKLGLTNNTTIGNIVSGRENKPSYDILKRIKKNFPEIDLNWLFTGKGQMLLENPDEISEALEGIKTSYKDGKVPFELILDEFSIDELITYIHKYREVRNFDENETYRMFLEIEVQRRFIAGQEKKNGTKNKEK